MKVIADFCLIPIGAGVSLSAYISICEKILSSANLKTQLHANGTNIEGEWEEVFSAIRRCHEAIHEMGVSRITTSLTFGTRTDKEQSMEEKIDSVRKRMIES